MQYAINKQSEEITLQRWIMGYQDQFSFDEFKEKLGFNNNSLDNRTSHEILNNVKQILASFTDKEGDSHRNI